MPPIQSGGKCIAMQAVLSITVWVLRLGIGSVFLYAGSIKLLNPHDFAVVISGYGLLPEQLILPVAFVLPVAEVLAAIGLVLGIRGSLPALTVMLLGFIAVLGYGILLGLDVDCGCFSSTDPEAAYKGLESALYRDILLLIGIAFLSLNQIKRPLTGRK